MRLGEVVREFEQPAPNQITIPDPVPEPQPKEQPVPVEPELVPA